MNIVDQKSKKTKIYKRRRRPKTLRRPQKPNSYTGNVSIFISCPSCAVKSLKRLQRKYSDRVEFVRCADPDCAAPHEITIRGTTRRAIAKLLKNIHSFEFVEES